MIRKVRLLSGQSIAVRLAVSAVFWSSLVLLVSGVILATLYRRNTERAFDERLLVYANDIAADLITPGDFDSKDLGANGDPRFDIPLSGWYWQVGRIDARPRDVKSSGSLVGETLPTLAGPETERPFGGTRKESVEGPEGRMVRVLERDIDLGEDGRYVVRVVGPADEISDAQTQFVIALVVTFLLVGAALGFSTLLQIRFGLRPLIRLGQAVAAVRRGQSERISGTYTPDVAPLADELNLLLEANREILDRARTQVGNLAHALKTPLSVIVNEADTPTGDLPERVREQADLMRHQVEYYLNRARAAALAGTLGTATDVKPVLEALGRTFGKIYRDRPLAISIAVPDGLRFLGERQDLEEMVGNLVDNACKWASSTVEIAAALSTERERPRLRITVEDDGPGLPEGAGSEALKRGRRFDETKPGSGLGLSIVADLARTYRGDLRLEAVPGGGARAVLDVLGDAAA